MSGVISKTLAGRSITESEALDDVSILFYMKSYLEASTSAPAEWRRIEARKLLAHALDTIALICGPEVLTLAYGAAGSDDRKDHLLALADRLQWPAQLFAGVGNARHGGFEALAEECESVARGDAPQLLAKLPGYRRNVRLLAAKFRATRWDAYLDGFGVPTADRHSALAAAFGQEWDTMSRWVKDASSAWGTETVDNRINLERHYGVRDRQQHDWIKDSHWQAAVQRSGRIFKRQAGYAA